MRLRKLLRSICWLRGRHWVREDFGGGADCLECMLCDARMCLRVYYYNGGNRSYGIISDPQWWFPK
jgi:hypothetical protein